MKLKDRMDCRMIEILYLNLLLLLVTACWGFHPAGNFQTYRRRCCALNLVPLSSFPNVTFLSSPSSYRACIEENGSLRCDPTMNDADNSENPFQLCIAEEDDLPDVATLTVNAFGSDVITLSGQLSPLEKALLKPGIGLINALDNSIAWVEVLSGLRSRMRYRIDASKQFDNMSDNAILLSSPPITNANHSDAEAIAAKSSLILVLARPSKDSDQQIDVIATVDVRLQPTDAKIPFSIPWIDSLERRLAKLLNADMEMNDLNLQPYISNLCVDESVRGRKVGKAMVRCVEKIVKDHWGYEQIYLHVDLDNLRAVNLYKSEGYQDVGSRWKPFWADGSIPFTDGAAIGYWYKRL
jgi:ribosomal protein S18 acetylase RimI-like enzyme